MKLKIIYLFFTLGLVINMQGQYMKDLKNEGMGRVFHHNTINDEIIKGNRYLLKEFTAGVLISKYNKKYFIRNLNIDCFNANFISKLGKGNDSIFIFNELKEVEINFKKYVKIDDKILNVIFKNDSITLFKDYTKIKTKKVIDKMTNTTIRESRWVNSNQYFYQMKGEVDLKKIIMKKKHILNMFNEKEQKILKKYIKVNHLTFKKQSDIVKIFNYYYRNN